MPKANSLILQSFLIIFKQIFKFIGYLLSKFLFSAVSLRTAALFLLLTRAAVKNRRTMGWYFLGNSNKLKKRKKNCVHTAHDSSAVVSSRKFRTKTIRKNNVIYNTSWKPLFQLFKKLVRMSVNTAHANNGVLIHAGE